MAEAYIIDAVRSAGGRRSDGFADVHPADFSAHPIRDLARRAGVGPDR